MSTQTEWNVNGMVYNEKGFIPVIAQDYESGEVLLLGQMNADAVNQTAETGYVHYCDETGAVKKFGAKDGNTQKLVVAFLDESGKTLLIKVKQKGLLFEDDSQIVRLVCQKFYTKENPFVIIRVTDEINNKECEWL